MPNVASRCLSASARYFGVTFLHRKMPLATVGFAAQKRKFSNRCLAFAFQPRANRALISLSTKGPKGRVGGRPPSSPTQVTFAFTSF